jgi:adenylate cyclase
MSNANPVLSVLFADVSGSVRRHERLDDGEALRAVDRCLKRMERAAEVFGGRIVKTVGDELMAVFDRPDQAFRAALEMQQRVADLPPVSGVKLAIRIGFSHGAVSQDQGCIAGQTVNAAAHLAGLANPGQVLTCLQAQSELSVELKELTRDLGSASATGQFPGMTLFELVSPSSAKCCASLCLRYGDQVVVLNDRPIRMGRDAQSDVEVRDRRASRQHAKIERRGERIVLIDSSTNGTYVTLNGEPEVFLRGEECVIHGKGMICFAASASSPDADCAQFD